MPISKNMKILFVITDLGVGGAELMLYRILSKMDRTQFSCEVVNLGDGGAVQSKIENLSVPVHNLNLRSFLSFPRGVTELRNCIERFNPDLVQGWMYHANVLATHALSKIKRKIPLLWGIRYSLADTSTNKWSTRFLIRYSGMLAKRVTKIVFNSFVSLEHHLHIGYPKETSMVIPNGINLEDWGKDPSAKEKLRTELRLPIGTPLIGMVGRFDSAKDHPTFLAAASIYSKKNPEAQYVLVGPGMDRLNQMLRSWIVKNDLELKVHLLGEREDMPYVTQGLDISTVASRTESFPNVLIEAMASGVPSVVSNIGDSPKVLGDTGRVFTARHPAQLAESWNQMLSEGPEKLRELGSRARSRVKENYSLDAVAAQYQNLFKTLVKN